uniref:Protein kinase domain-containing protein n=1 Tax=Oryza brachyantha TaxID=4533 RepID=J3M108_ORYBR
MVVCRRASFPATPPAAAVASPPPRPPGPPPPPPPGAGPPPPLPNSPLQMNLTCEDVPFPFGERSGASPPPPGFVVTCGPNNEAMLQIGEHRYIIDEVSVPESYITILAGPIKQTCYDRGGRPTQTTGIGAMNLESTPFSFSKRNALVATGCNYRFVAYFTNSSGGESGDPQPTTCGTWCNGSSDSIINGSCNLACCKADMLMDGAKEFTLTFSSSWPSRHVSGEEASTCSAVFFLDQEEQVFTGAGSSRKMPLKEALVPPGYRRMVLDWAIPGSNCEQSLLLAAQYQCGSMSTCIDVPGGAGYRCRCNAGYDGNPYEQNGCTDINECRDVGSNNCSSLPICHNTDGGYTCTCPRGMVGDGYKTGTGCIDPPLTPGQDVCAHLEKNPCMYTEYCKDGQGVTTCTCPKGMSGDGQKKGSGCKRQFPLDTALGVGLALMVVLGTTLMCYYWTMKKRKVAKERAELFRKNGGLLLQQRFSTITPQGEDSSAKIFSAEELKNATDNYNESRILGRGGSGMVYKGVLPNNTMVAIKKSIVFDESQVEQFVNEITILSQIDHPNVVKLLGCCLETKVPLLVYEFIPNGTLFQRIHSRSTLTWEDCLRIAAETAEALAYLHSTSTPIIHRDIKSSNILLDENLVAKISDFGASRSIPLNHTHVTTLIQGTIGYLDPEYFQSSQLTEKSDVYSFGVVLAELLTRQRPISVGSPEESCNLAMYIVILFNERRLLQEIEPRILAEAGEEQIYAVAQLSVRCLNSTGEERPVMGEVASVLRRLRESFAKEQTVRRNDESVQIINEQESAHSEPKPTSSLQSSEETTMRYSLPAEILASSHLAR